MEHELKENKCCMNEREYQLNERECRLNEKEYQLNEKERRLIEKEQQLKNQCLIENSMCDEAILSRNEAILLRNETIPLCDKTILVEKTLVGRNELKKTFACNIKKRTHIMHNWRTCNVAKINHTTSSKYGNSKLAFELIDLINSKKNIVYYNSDQLVDEVSVIKENYEIIDVSNIDDNNRTTLDYVIDIEIKTIIIEPPEYTKSIMIKNIIDDMTELGMDVFVEVLILTIIVQTGPNDYSNVNIIEYINQKAIEI